LSREHALNLLIERGLKSEIEFYNISGSEKEIKQDLIKHCKYRGGALREWMFQCNYNKVDVSLGRYDEKRTKFEFTWNEIAKEIFKRNAGVEQLSLF
jgi:hypothetical protein